MPLYDFACKCGEVTEVRQRMDVTFILCPACGGTAKRTPFPSRFGIAGETVAKPSQRTLTQENKAELLTDLMDRSEEARLEHRKKVRQC